MADMTERDVRPVNAAGVLHRLRGQRSCRAPRPCLVLRRSAPSPTLSAPPQLLRLKSVLLKVLMASPARLGSHLRRIACSAVRRR